MLESNLTDRAKRVGLQINAEMRLGCPTGAVDYYNTNNGDAGGIGLVGLG